MRLRCRPTGHSRTPGRSGCCVPAPGWTHTHTHTHMRVLLQRQEGPKQSRAHRITTGLLTGAAAMARWFRRQRKACMRICAALASVTVRGDHKRSLMAPRRGHTVWCQSEKSTLHRQCAGPPTPPHPRTPIHTRCHPQTGTAAATPTHVSPHISPPPPNINVSQRLSGMPADAPPPPHHDPHTDVLSRGKREHDANPQPVTATAHIPMQGSCSYIVCHVVLKPSRYQTPSVDHNTR